MDLSAGAIADQLIGHALLIVGLSVVGWWLYPLLFKKTLQNGGGELIRDLVRLENIDQSALHDDRLRDAFADHEVRERIEVAAALALARSDARVESESIKTDLHNLRNDVQRIEDHLWPK